MEIHFTWKTKHFKGLYEIYENENIVGELKSSGWKRIATGRLQEAKVLFEIKGFWEKEFLIKSTEDNSVTGKIVFNTWRTKATINYGDKEYNWQSNNFFNTKWSISNENGDLVKYQAHCKFGEITSYTRDEQLILTGLFIRDYLRQRAAVAAASV